MERVPVPIGYTGGRDMKYTHAPKASWLTAGEAKVTDAISTRGDPLMNMEVGNRSGVYAPSDMNVLMMLAKNNEKRCESSSFTSNKLLWAVIIIIVIVIIVWIVVLICTRNKGCCNVCKQTPCTCVRKQHRSRRKYRKPE